MPLKFPKYEALRQQKDAERLLSLGNEDKDVESLLDTCIKEVGTMSLIFRVGNNYIRHTPYLRNSIAYDHDFWHTGTGVK